MPWFRFLFLAQAAVSAASFGAEGEIDQPVDVIIERDGKHVTPTVTPEARK